MFISLVVNTCKQLWPLTFKKRGDWTWQIILNWVLPQFQHILLGTLIGKSRKCLILWLIIYIFVTHNLWHIIYAIFSDRTMESSNLPDIWRVNLNPRKVSKDNYDPSKEVFNWEFVGFMPYEVFFHSSAYDENRFGLYLKSRNGQNMIHMI